MTNLRYFGLLTIAMLVASTGDAARGDLPDENTLPESPRVATVLPGENTLPETTPDLVTPPEISDPQDPPTEQEPPENGLPKVGPPADWPDESQLPPPAPGAETGKPPENQVPDPDQDPKQPAKEPEVLPPVGQPPMGRPWLRLNMSGHTGVIRSLTYSRAGEFLLSGGEDKALEVWTRMNAAMNSRRPWMHERTVRWQVHRADRGRIYSIAAGGRYVAIAGKGAMGGLGEILLLDPVTGNLNAALFDDADGHRQVVAGLAFSPGADASMLASQDLDGQSILWKRNAAGLWRPNPLYPPDHAAFPAEMAKALQDWRLFVPIAMAGSRQVILARPLPQVAGKPLKWKLVSVDTQTLDKRDIPGSDVHLGMVTVLAANPQGTCVVTADAQRKGVVHFWNPRNNLHQQREDIGGMPMSASFSQDGRYLLLGTRRNDGQPGAAGQAEVQLWDVADVRRPRQLKRLGASRDVYGCALSPDATQFAYTQGNKIYAGRLGVIAGGRASLVRAHQIIGPPIRPALRVAFSLEKPYYRIGIGYQNVQQRTPFEDVFDPDKVQLRRGNRLAQTGWMSSDWARGDWSVDVETDPQTRVVRTWLKKSGQRVAQLPLLPARHGTKTATCWIPDMQGNPYAVAVGTDGRNNIYVYRLGRKPTLIRQFRGHWSAVNSLGVSRDRRYLVSAAEDSTIRVWKLRDFDTADGLVNQWGADFKVENNQLVATAVRDDGGMHGRGLRTGDVITRLEFKGDADRDTAEDDPTKMLQILQGYSFDKIVFVSFRRGNAAQRGFNMYPAWPPVASLFVNQQGEWAYWTPAGYYDASFNGHKMFGWQINHGRRVLPEFFLAAQMREKLERPELMEKLLDAGSIEKAFRAARQVPPVDAQQVVSDQYRLKPRIEILSPSEHEAIEQNSVPVRVAITVRDGQTLVPPKVFANGVVATKRRLVKQEKLPGRIRYEYVWDARLPSDPRIVLQVVAATDARVFDVKTQKLSRRVSPTPGRSRMFVFAAGINRYQDAQIQGLDFAVNNASTLVGLLRQRSHSFYDSHVASLLDGNATRSMWKVVTEQYAEQIRDDVAPDDLLVIYLSGHGVRDEDTKKYYYVTANARYADIKAQRYGDCMSLEDLSVFSDIPCRKLVILDTCHSGAVQPLQQKNLKAAMRALQDDMVITLTASDGGEEAVEEKKRQMGRFTYQLVEALRGEADRTAQTGNRDKTVTLGEAIEFVRRAVADDSAEDAYKQTPTAGPPELLPYINLPLTSND